MRAREQKIFNIFDSKLQQKGFELLCIRISDQKRLKVQFFIDRLDQTSIQIGDCEQMSKYLGVLLDVEACLTGSYELQVLSPGLDRPLTKIDHFKRFVGQKVMIKTRVPHKGQQRFQGKIIAINSCAKDVCVQHNKTQNELLHHNEQNIVFLSHMNGQEMTHVFAYDQIENAHLVPDFKKGNKTL